MKAINAPFYSGLPEDISLGWEQITRGMMGTILLAGGMGTRLQFDHPKGLYPISPVSNKSLFQLFAEKCYQASLKAKRDLPIAIMTSPENDFETREFFKNHNFFNLKPSQVSFFVQGELPMEDESGRPLDVKAADGNGGVFKKFVESGLYAKWKEIGVTALNILLVDNPLADPFDANLLGHHLKTNSDVTIKCVERTSPTERVGLLVEIDHRVKVVEYSEIDSKEASCTENGQLKHKFANLSLFCLSMDFVKELSSKQFPYHIAKKPATKESGAPMLCKKETFIFDLLDYANRPSLLTYPRDQVFAPLKNHEGADSPETVKEALSRHDKNVYKQIFEKDAPEGPYELPIELLYH